MFLSLHLYTGGRERFKKKPVALLCGYVGAGFRGNMNNPTIERGSTVDDVLEVRRCRLTLG